MAVLVTRPDQQGRELCQRLVDVGIPAIHHPLINIVANRNGSNLVHQLTECDILIAVSQHAVNFAHQLFSNASSNWPTDVIYLAVGQKTAHYLSKLSQQKVNYPLVGDSEHLLEVPELQDVDGKRILILRGNGGRELIYQRLVQRQAKVEYCETYCREFISFSAESAYPYWQQHDVTRIVVTSSEQLAFLVSQTPPIYQTWLFNLQLLVPSQRIVETAINLGFINALNVGSASNSDLLATLQP